jgi:MinD superfamily P-loop ATPase
MLRPEIIWDYCQVCDPCSSRGVCNVRAIVIIDPGDPAYIDLTRCNGCGLCIDACPHDAIVMRNNQNLARTG